MQIIGIFLIVFSSLLSARTEKHGLDLPAEKNQRDVVGKEVKSKFYDPSYYSLKDFTDCGTPIANDPDKTYRLMRKLIVRDKNIQYAPAKENTIGKECAVIVYDKKIKQVVGTINDSCPPQKGFVNNSDTFLKGSSLNPSEPPYDVDHFYRFIDGEYKKAGCVIQTKKGKKAIPQQIAFINQFGHCVYDTFGEQNPRKEPVEITSSEGIVEDPYQTEETPTHIDTKQNVKRSFSSEQAESGTIEPLPASPTKSKAAEEENMGDMSP